MQGPDAWLKIAKDDLTAAKALMELELFSTVAYLCQQAAEKSLKAYLVFKQRPVTKTHDLTQLLELCMAFERDFGELLYFAQELNPFATRFRYPSEFEVPSRSDAEHAIGTAQKIMRFAIKKMTKEETGQSKIF